MITCSVCGAVGFGRISTVIDHEVDCINYTEDPWRDSK